MLAEIPRAGEVLASDRSALVETDNLDMPKLLASPPKRFLSTSWVLSRVFYHGKLGCLEFSSETTSHRLVS